MNNNIFDNYNQSPEIIEYQNHMDKNGNEVYVKDGVVVRPIQINVDWIFQSTENKIMASLSPYLQRILLTQVWKAFKYAKAKSYIRDLWKGLGPSTPFFFVPIDLVLRNIEQALSDVTDEDVISQIMEVKNKVEELMADGVQLIILDGQTRSNEAIVPYIKGQFSLNVDDGLSKVVEVKNSSNKFVDISSKTFPKLDRIQKGYFLNQQIIVNLLLEGDLDDITNALISINSNEKWTAWQEIYHGSFKSPIGARIFEVIENCETGVVRDFFSNKVTQKGAYDLKVSGWEQYVAEHLYFLKHKSWASLNDLKQILKGVEPSPNKSYSKKLKNYLMEIIDNYSSSNKLFHQTISNYIIFRDVLDNHNNKNDAFYSHFPTPKVMITSESKFLNWFIKKIDWLTSKTNPESYQIINGILDRLPDSYPAHAAGGYKLKSIIGRVKLLINELNNDLDELLTERTIDNNKSMPKKSDVLISNNYKSLGGTLIDPTKKSSDKYERGHVIADANGGSRELDNFVPEVKQSNRKRGARNIEKVGA